jgi:hypothetical protein
MTGIRILLLGIGMAAGMGFLKPPVSAGRSTASAAPDVRNTSWKALYPAISDTVTLRFGDDSSAILSPTGVPILSSIFKLKNDLVIFHDVGGLNACRDFSGSYHVRINGDTLVLVIDEDPCDTRAGMLIIKPWIRKQ